MAISFSAIGFRVGVCDGVIVNVGVIVTVGVGVLVSVCDGVNVLCGVLVFVHVTVCVRVTLLEDIVVVGIDVPAGPGVGVIVIKRRPLDATLVANTESIEEPYGMVTAVFVGVIVAVSVGVGVTVFVGVWVTDGVTVCVTKRNPPFAALVAATESNDDPYGITTAVTVIVWVGVPLAVGVLDGVGVDVT
jgi:hypothetical protein